MISQSDGGFFAFKYNNKPEVCDGGGGYKRQRTEHIYGQSPYRISTCIYGTLRFVHGRSYVSLSEINRRGVEK